MGVVDINPEEAVIVDGKGTILGRLASKVAKLLLKGKKVIILNAGEIVISGKPENIFEKYQEWQNVITLTNPRKGPFHYSRPDLFVKRRIRGMLPWKKMRGRKAYDHLRVYIGIPQSCEDLPKKKWPDIQEDRLNKMRKRVTVREVCEKLA